MNNLIIFAIIAIVTALFSIAVVPIMVAINYSFVGEPSLLDTVEKNLEFIPYVYFFLIAVSLVLSVVVIFSKSRARLTGLIAVAALVVCVVSLVSYSPYVISLAENMGSY